ncbi:DUF2093 domain-containing protein [Sandarakinorhabdus oryzae]|uniref:DUF2093 domain-containing protein n=1 Tax=Sandarakinorhabdus oryzae TaxID=2675220 RepID=UPI0012E19EAE|nr:DUF2093 domain-containing protein [Sandarakinorhabdus oryzae]
MLDRFGRPARLLYESGSYRILEAGDHVLCAVTGQRINLAALRYWSHELQEAYASADIASRRYAEMRAKGQFPA